MLSHDFEDCRLLKVFSYPPFQLLLAFVNSFVFCLNVLYTRLLGFREMFQCCLVFSFSTDAKPSGDNMQSRKANMSLEFHFSGSDKTSLPPRLKLGGNDKGWRRDVFESGFTSGIQNIYICFSIMFQESLFKKINHVGFRPTNKTVKLGKK